MDAELRAAYAAVIIARRDALERRERAEVSLRQAALDIFAKTGRTPVAPGVTVHVGRSGMPYAIISGNLNDLWPETGEAGGVE